MKKINYSNQAKIISPASSYNFHDDKRLLIPFMEGRYIGFMNQDLDVVVSPAKSRYTMYYGECYSDTEKIKVAVDYLYGFNRASGTVSSYLRTLYGLINSNGEEILKPEFFALVSAIGNSEIYTVQNRNFEYGVIDITGRVIIPFGKYDYIGGFDKGLARVKIGKQSSGLVENNNRWGLIDIIGNEVLPIEYDAIWSFYGKKYNSIIVEIDGSRKSISIYDLRYNEKSVSDDYTSSQGYGSTYNEYNGTYAQDVAGYSDDVINDAFDGDPEAYWNID